MAEKLSIAELQVHAYEPRHPGRPWHTGGLPDFGMTRQYRPAAGDGR